MAFFLYFAFVALSYLRPVEAFAPDLQVYRPMVILGLVALYAAGVQALAAGRTAARERHFMLMLALLACIALSKIMNGWAGGAAEALSDFSTSALMFLLTVLNVTSIQRVRLTLATIVLSTLIISVAGLAAYHYGFMVDRLVLRQQIGEEGDDQPADAVDIPANDTSGQYLWRVRNIGFLGDPNDFAQAIVVALPMLGIWYRQRRFFRNVALLGVPGAALLYTVYLTHSRGAVLGLVSLLFFGMRKTLGVVKMGLLVGALLVAIVVMNVAGGRGFSAQEESAGGRILAWSEGLIMLRYHPLFGVGYNNFTEHHNYTAHNSFVLCFAELGLIGYFTWLALVVTAFRDVNQVAGLSEGTGLASRPYAAMLRSSLLGFLTCAFFLSRTYAPPLFLLLALCVVTCQYAGAEESNPKLLPAQGWALLTIAILVGSIALVYVMVLGKHATG